MMGLSPRSLKGNLIGRKLWSGLRFGSKKGKLIIMARKVVSNCLFQGFPGPTGPMGPKGHVGLNVRTF